MILQWPSPPPDLDKWIVAMASAAIGWLLRHFTRKK